MTKKDIARRVLAFFLSLAMLVGAIPAPVLAQSGTATRGIATTTSPRGVDPTQAMKGAIEADAIKNGYVKANADFTNAKNTLSGRAWIVDRGVPSTVSNGLTAVPEGTKVYLRWIDTDGAVSPLYVASTTNKLSDADGAQNGPGAYCFDLRNGWIDRNGTTHTYRAQGGQYYSLWIPTFKSPTTGNKVTMLRQVGGFFPGVFAKTSTSMNLGQFPLLGTNMQRTGIFMFEQGGSYMHRPKAEWKTLPTLPKGFDPIGGQTANGEYQNNYFQGRVWLESGAGDYANSATGPNYNPNNSGTGDLAVKGYKVVASYLTEQGRIAYDQATKTLPVNKLTQATKDFLELHPDYIEETIVATTDEEGFYSFKLDDSNDPNKVDKIVNHMYFQVFDDKGELVNAYSSFTSPIYQLYNKNDSFRPQNKPSWRPARHAVYNLNFAVVPDVLLDLDVTNFNTTDKPAGLGDIAEADIRGKAVPPFETKIVWTNEKGDVLKETKITALKQGTDDTYQLPKTAAEANQKNIKDGEVIKAALVCGGNEIASDSFIFRLSKSVRLHRNAPEALWQDLGITDKDVEMTTIPLEPDATNKIPDTIDLTKQRNTDSYKSVLDKKYSFVGWSTNPKATAPDRDALVTEAAAKKDLTLDLYVRDGKKYKVPDAVRTGDEPAVDLYAVWKPYFTVKASKAWTDGTKDIQAGLYDTAKLKFGLLTRTAVGAFGEEVVVKAATYKPVPKTIQEYKPGQQLVWNDLRGFDEDGRRISYVVVELTDDQMVKDFEAGKDSTQSVYDLDVQEKKLKPDGSVDHYGRKFQYLTFKQAAGSKMDAFTAATSRKHFVDADHTVAKKPYGADRVGYFETTGYEIVATNKKVELLPPAIHQAKEGEKDVAIKLQKPADIVDIAVKLGQGATKTDGNLKAKYDTATKTWTLSGSNAALFTVKPDSTNPELGFTLTLADPNGQLYADDTFTATTSMATNPNVKSEDVTMVVLGKSRVVEQIGQAHNDKNGDIVVKAQTPRLLKGSKIEVVSDGTVFTLMKEDPAHPGQFIPVPGVAPVTYGPKTIVDGEMTFTIPKALANENEKLYVQTKEANRDPAVSTVNTTIDKTAPVLEGDLPSITGYVSKELTPAEAQFNDPNEVKLVSHNTSAGITVKLDDQGKVTYSGTPEEQYDGKYKIKLEDKFGNTSIFKIPAKIYPQVSPNNPPKGVEDKYFRITFKADDHSHLVLNGEEILAKKYYVLKEADANATIPLAQLETQGLIVPGYKITDDTFKAASPLWAPDVLAEKYAFNQADQDVVLQTVAKKDVVPQKPGEGKPDVPKSYVKVEFAPGENGTIADTETTVYWVNPKKEVTLTAPKVTAKDGYVHAGWDKALTDVFDKETKITATYRAKVLTEDPQDSKNYAKIAFTANRGTLEGTSTYWVLKNEEVSLTAPKVNNVTGGYTFDKWDPEVQTKYDADTTHKATYAYNGDNAVPQKPGENKPDVPSTFVKVQFLPGQHGIIKNTETTIYWVNPEKEVTLTAPSVIANDGYTHMGWNKPLKATFAQATDITAQYKQTVVTNEPKGGDGNPDTDYVKVDFNKGAHGEFVAGEKTTYWVIKDQTVNLTAPKVTAATGWVQKEGKDAWSPAIETSYNGAKTHTAQYAYNGENVVPQKPGENKPDVPANFVAITFKDGAHGKIDDGQAKTYWVNPGAEVTLPALKVTADKGYTHTGWKPALKGTFTTATDITAQYKQTVVTVEPKGEDQNPDTDYAKVSFTTDNGSLEGQATYWVLKNEEVKLTAPTLKDVKEGFTFKEWTPAVKTSYAEDTEHKATFTDNRGNIIPLKPGDETPVGYVKVTLKNDASVKFADGAKTDYAVKKDAGVRYADVYKQAGATAAEGYTTPITWNDGTKNVEPDGVIPTTGEVTLTAKATEVKKDIIEVKDPTSEVPQGYHRVTLTVDGDSMKPFAANTVHIFDVRDGADIRLGDLTKKVSVEAKEGFKNPAWYDGNAVYDQMAKVTENKTLTAKAAKTDATANNPEGQTVTKKQGEPLDPKEFVKNPENLPGGTKFTFKDTPAPNTNDTTDPNGKDVKVIVTYPDGSTDEVTGKLVVTEKDKNNSETFNPKDKNIDTKVGVTPDAKDTIDFGKNGGQDIVAPEGTLVVWKEKPDVSTVKDNVPGKVTVIYPDGSREDVDVTVNVKEADKNIIPVDNPNEPAKDGYVRVTLTNDKNSVEDFTGTTNFDVKKNAGVALGDITAKITPVAKTGYENPKWYDGENEYKALDRITDQGKTLTAKATEVKKDVIEVKDPNSEVPQGYHRVTLKVDDASMKPFAANTVHIFDVRDGADTRLGDLTAKVSVEAKEGFKNPAWYDGNAVYDQMAKVTENKTLTAKAAKTDATANNPEGQTVTKKQGEPLDPKEFVKNPENLPGGTKFTFKDTPAPNTNDTTDPNGKDVKVIVTYPDGSTDEVTGKLVVTEKDKNNSETFNPKDKNIDTKVGVTPDAKDTIDFGKNGGQDIVAPEGTVVVWKEKPDVSTVKDNVPGKVTVIYPDGSREDVDVTVNVKEADKNIIPVDNPNKPAKEGYVRVTLTNDKNSVEDFTGTTSFDVKKNAGVALGDITAKITPVAKTGYKNPKWYDGENEYKALDRITDQGKTLTAKAAQTDATANNPEGQTVTKKQGEPLDPKEFVKNPENLPTGTKFTFKDPAPNTNDTTDPNGKDVKVVVTYPDGSTDEVTGKLVVTEKDKNIIPLKPGDETPVGYVKVTLKHDASVKFADGAKTDYAVKKDAGVRYADVYKQAGATAAEGYTTPITWNDGTKNVEPDGVIPTTGEITLTAKAVKVEENKDKIIPGKENENPPKGYIAISVVNDKTSVKTEVKRIYWVKNDESVRYNDIVLRVNADLGTENITLTPNKDYREPFNWQVKADQATEAKDLAPAGVPADKDTLIVSATIKDNKNPAYPAPEGQKITVDQGDTPNAEDGIKNKDKLPNGTKYDFKEKPNTSTPGTQNVVVVVTYPDGSTNEVPIELEVKEKGNIIPLKPGDQTPDGYYRVKLTADPSSVAFKAGVETDYAVKKGADVTLGQVTAKVEAQAKPGYETVKWYVGGNEVAGTTKVTSDLDVLAKADAKTPVQTDADKNDPKGQDITVNQGQAPDPMDGIKNKDELKNVKSYTFKDPVDTSHPGTIKATVVVTYKDGTTDEVLINVFVKKEPSTPPVIIDPKPDKPEKPDKTDIINIGGKDRTDVAVDISKTYFKDATKVIVVQDNAYADAMSATNVSQGRYPILYVGKNTLYDVTKAEILRTQRSEIIVMGGVNTISANVLNQLKALGVKVTRVDGADRYEVNRNSIVKYMPNSSKAVIASGMLYMDALSSVPYAHALKASIVLVNKDTVPPVIAKLLTTKMKDAVIVGGPNTIAPKNKTNLEALMGKGIERIGGTDRYAVSADVSKRLAKVEHAIVTSGVKWSDALVAGPLAQKLNAPVLLTAKNSLPSPIFAYLDTHKNLKSVITVGGMASIGGGVRTQLQALFGAKVEE